MNAKRLTDIVTEHGNASKEGNALRLPAEKAATFYVGLEGESLVVDRVTHVEAHDDVVVLTTSRKETFVVAPEDVCAVRFAAKDSAAGY